MKLLIKYIWTLVLIPAFFFIKGDLSWDAFRNINELNPEREITKRVKDAFEPSSPKLIEFKVNAVSTSENFSAEGMKVELYDHLYNLLQKSQVVGGRVKFKLDPIKSNIEKFNLVCPTTADELKINSENRNAIFSIHEKYIREDEDELP